MKKILISFILLIALCFTLTSCDDNFLADIFKPQGPQLDDNRTVILSESEIEVVRGETHTLSAKLSVGKADFVWTSSDESVATVDEKGVVTAHSLGTATITATTDDKSAFCEITVVLPANIPVFEDDRQELFILQTNTFAINSKVLYNGEEVEADVTFASDDESIATVDENGLVTGVALGNTFIQVVADYLGMTTYMNVEVSVQPNIVVEVSTATVELSTVTILGTDISSTYDLTMSIFEKGVDLSGSIEIVWTLEDGSVAAVEGEGTALTVKALSEGTTNLKAAFTVYDVEYEYDFVINVNKANVLVAPVNGEMKIDLSAVEGTVSSLTIDGKSYTSALKNGILTLAKKEMTGGSHAAVLTTSAGTYSFDITADIKVVTLDKEEVSLENGKFVFDLSDINFSGNVYSLTIGNYNPVTTQYTNVKEFIGGFANSVLTVNKSDISYGDNYRLSIMTDGSTDYVMDLVLWSREINNTSAPTPSEFVNNLKAKPDGSFIVTEDIDWNGAKLVGVVKFSGTLDGQGHRLGNFVIDINNGSSNYESIMFEENKGTIQNVEFDYTMTRANGGNALIKTNEGTVTNCVFKVKFDYNHNAGTPYTVAPIAGTSKGTSVISNCIVIITAGDGKPNTSIGIGPVVSGIVGASAIKNTLVVYNNLLNENSLELPYVSGNVDGNPIFEGNKNYAFVADLYNDVSAFDATKGWSEYFTIQNGEIYFGGRILAEKIDTIPNRTTEATNGKYILDFGGDNLAGAITSVKLGSTDLTNYLSGSTLIIPTSAVAEGKHTVVLTTSEKKYTFELTLVIPEMGPMELNQENAGTPAKFAELIKSNAKGEFYLGSDLDWGGASANSIIDVDFNGVIDGKGYTIKNFKLTNGSMFTTYNYGTIKNIGFDYTLENTSAANTGIVYENRGILENIYLNVNVIGTQKAGVLSAINRGHYIRNIVVNLTSLAGTKNADIGTLTSAHRPDTYTGSGRQDTYENCYVIHNGVTSATTRPNCTSDPYVATTTTFKTYVTLADMLAEVTELPASAGWSEYWTIENGEIVLKP